MAEALSLAETSAARPEVQRLWRRRAALHLLLTRAATLPLTIETLAGLHHLLTQERAPAPNLTAGVTLPAVPAACALRSEALVLSRTTYRPPSDPVLIEACCAQVIGKAAAIADPYERSFFLWVHLLALLPWASMNATLACPAAALALLGAGQRPLALASIAGADLQDALLGWWVIAEKQK